MKGAVVGETLPPLGPQAFEMLSHLSKRSSRQEESVEHQTPVPAGVQKGCQAFLSSRAKAWTRARVSSRSMRKYRKARLLIDLRGLFMCVGILVVV